MHVRAPFWPPWSRGVGGVKSWTSLGVRGPGPATGQGGPPIHRLGRTRALSFANIIFNSQLKFQILIQIKFSNGRSVCRYSELESYNWNFKMQLISNTSLKFNSTVTSSYVLCLRTQLAMSISP
jgi:hypothetical protein